MPDVVQIRIEVDGANAPATLQSLVSSLNLVTTAIKGADTAERATVATKQASAAASQQATAGHTAQTTALGVLRGAMSGAQTGATGLLGVMKQFANNLAGGIASIPDHFKRTGDEANAASGHVGTLRAMLASLGQYVGVGAAIAGGMGLLRGALEAIGGLRDTFIGVNAQLEQTRLRFAVFLGDADQARGFVKQLQDEASRSTFGLNQIEAAAGSLLAYNVSATQVIPILRGIQNAAAAAGGDLNENFATLSRVIGELAGGLPITERQVRQLVQAGIPLKPLADQLGITVDQLLNVGKTGIITSAQFVAAFTEIYTHGKLGDYMHEQAQTFTGALQLVRTDLQIAGATAFKPFFDILRDGLVTVSVFVQSDAWGVWSQRISTGTQIAAAALRSLFGEVGTVFDGIKDAIARFEQGGIAGVFQPLLDAGRMAVANLLHTFEDGGNGFFAAGANLIATYASGMWQSATGILSSVVNEIADFIGQFFIGQSPPPKGPLKQIHQGGATLMQAYVDGMWGGLGGLSDLGKNVLDQLTNALNTGGESGFDFATLKDNLQSGVLSMDELKASGEGVDDVLAMITSSLGDIADKQAGIKDQEADIKDHYDSIIDPLQRQLDILKETVDYTTKRRDLELEIADNNINLAMANDPALQGLDKTLSNLQAQKARAAVAPINRADENRIASLQQQERALPSGTAGAARRKALEDEIAGIRDRDRVAADGQTDAQRALDAQIQSVKDQIDARKAGYQQQLDANKEEKNKVDLLGKQKDLAQQLLELPLEQKIAAAKREEADRLDPLIKASGEYDKQTRALDTQKRGWDGLKTSIADALQPLTEANKYQASLDAQAKSAAGKSAKPGGAEGDIPGVPKIAIPKLPEIKFTPPDFTKMGEHAAETFVAGAKAYIENNFGSLIGSAVGGALGGAVLGPVGAVAGSLLGSAFGKALQTSLDALGIDWTGVKGALNLGIQQLGQEVQRLSSIFVGQGFGAGLLAVAKDVGAFGAPIAAKVRDWGAPLLAELGDLMTKRVWPWIEGQAGPLAERIGGWGSAFVDFVKPYVGPMLEALGGLAQRLLGWIEGEIPAYRDKLFQWGRAFVEWIGPRTPDILVELGKLYGSVEASMITMLGKIVVQLGKWGAEFVAWVAPRVGPMLDELGRLIGRLGDWTTAQLPTIVDRLAAWGKRFVAWVAPQIPPLLLELGLLWAKLEGWILERIPTITEHLAKWGIEFGVWVDTIWPRLIIKLIELELQLGKWIVEQAPDLAKNIGEWTAKFVDWAGDVLKPENLKKKLGDIKTELFNWIKDLAPDLEKQMATLVQPLLSPFDAVLGGVKWFTGKIGEALHWITDGIGIKDIISVGGWGGPSAIPTSATAAPAKASTGGGVAGAGGALDISSLLSPGAPRPVTSGDLASIAHANSSVAHPMGRGGFPDIGGILGGIKDLPGDALGKVFDLVGKGAGVVVDEAMKKFGVTLDLAGGFKDFGTAVFGKVVAGIKESVGDLFGRVQKEVGDGSVVSAALGMLSGDGSAWNGWCERFVGNVADAVGAGRPRAASALAHLYSIYGSIRQGIGPPGSVQYWGSNIGPDGHVDINGPKPGQGISTGPWGIGVVDQSRFGPSAGWAPIQLSEGGIVMREDLYHLHPREAVIPLDKAGRGGGPLGGEVHVHNHFHIAGSVVSDRQVVAMVRDGLEGLARSGVTLRFDRP